MKKLVIYISCTKQQFLKLEIKEFGIEVGGYITKKLLQRLSKTRTNNSEVSRVNHMLLMIAQQGFFRNKEYDIVLTYMETYRSS